MIRPATNEDFDFLYSLYMHPAANRYLLYEPMDKESFRPFFEELVMRDIKYIFEVNNKAVGMFKLYGHTHRSAHVAYLGGFAIDPTEHGKGYGLSMLREIIPFAQSKAFSRIELSTAVGNESALRVYEKAGFQREGILRKYTYLKSEDLYLDEVLMSWVG
jgi:putative acetyltransferase